MDIYNKNLAKNTLILGVGQLIPKALGIIILPVLTTYLSTSNYGIFDLTLSFAGLLVPIITMQMQQAVFRYLLLFLDKKKRTEYVTTAICYVLFFSLVILFGVYWILRCLKLDFDISGLICVMYWAETIYILLGQIVRGLGFNLKYAISVIVYSVTNVISVFLFVIFLKLELRGVLLAWMISYIVADMYMLFTSGINKFVRIEDFSVNSLKELLNFSFPIVPSSISLWIVNLSDRLIVSNYLGSDANGIYAVANRIPLLYSTTYEMFNLAWTETASKVLDDGNQEQYYSVLFSHLFKFLVGIMLLLIVVTPLLFYMLIKGEYKVAINQVPILYVGAFFNSFINFYSGIYIALKRTKQVGISSIVGAIINIVINFLLISKIGLYAASISTAVSFIIIAIYRAYDLNKVIKISYNFKDIFEGFVVLFLCCYLLYVGGRWTIILCGFIACVYNFRNNSAFVCQIIGSIRKKLKR